MQTNNHNFQLTHFVLLIIINLCLYNATYSKSLDSNDTILGKTDAYEIKDSYIVPDKDAALLEEKKVIYSTKNFSDVELIQPSGNAHRYESIAKLPQVMDNFIIHVLTGGDNNMYYIQGNHLENFDFHASLDISPFWEEPWEDGDYRKKHFEVYSDYTIRISTEERLDGEINTFTKYYRINKDGEFYQLDESEL